MFQNAWGARNGIEACRLAAAGVHASHTAVEGAKGLLSALGLKLYQPGLALLTAAVPVRITAWMWGVFAVDCALSAGVLLKYHDTELLSLPALLRQLRASSQSSTSR